MSRLRFQRKTASGLMTSCSRHSVVRGSVPSSAASNARSAVSNRATAAQSDTLPALRTFAIGLDKDWDAVLGAVTSPWSSGIVEGTVTKIKLVKRQMYGRAGLPLLRKRVLLL
ncbi:transposase [Catenulispora sp. MAP5-51]